MNYVFCHTTATSLINHQDEELNIFPNPASNSITIETKNAELTSAVIFDSKGTEVMKQELQNGNNKINLEKFSEGIYFIQITGNNKTYHKKIIVSN